MREVAFTIPVEPVAQGRPRLSSRGGFARAYDPPKSRAYKKTVAKYAQQAMGEANLDGLLEGPLIMRARFAFPLAKSHYRKRTPLVTVYRAKKPDLDNICKALTDGCEGIVYLNDSQVAKMVVEKVTLGQGEPAYTSVLFQEMN